MPLFPVSRMLLPCPDLLQRVPPDLSGVPYPCNVFLTGAPNSRPHFAASDRFRQVVPVLIVSGILLQRVPHWFTLGSVCRSPVRDPSALINSPRDPLAGRSVLPVRAASMVPHLLPLAALPGTVPAHHRQAHLAAVPGVPSQIL